MGKRPAIYLGALACVACLVASLNSHAATGVVRLKNGGKISGELIEVVPDQYVRIKTAEGIHKEVPWSEVEGVDEDKVVAPPASAGPALSASAAPIPTTPSGAKAATPPGAWKLPKGFFLVPRIGFVLGGPGRFDTESGLASSSNNSAVASQNKTRDASLFLLGLEFLFGIHPNIRVGLGALYTPSTKLRADNATFELGSDLDGVGLVEGAYALSSGVAVTLRGLGGLTVLLSGGDLKKEEDEGKRQIDQSTKPVVDWTLNKGPYLGWTAGGGVGALFKTGPVRPRVEFLVQHLNFGEYSLEVIRTDGSGGTEKQTARDTFKSTRFLLLLGVEIL